jgi:hypothetical protein
LVSHLVDSGEKVVASGGIEDDLSGSDPVFFSLQWGLVVSVVPNDNWLLLLQPLQVARRFVTRRIDLVALVYRPHRDAVVIFC